MKKGSFALAGDWLPIAAATPVILAGGAVVMVAHGRAEATAAAAGRHGTVRS